MRITLQKRFCQSGLQLNVRQPRRHRTSVASPESVNRRKPMRLLDKNLECRNEKRED